MKLRTFYALCCLCTFALSEEIDWEDRSASNYSSTSEELNNTREKRALGLILSGLAQVFGYTVDPVQLASLPNQNPDSNNANSTQASPNNVQDPCNKNNSTNATRPAQRETIRLTGVLNFGNGTVLNHLQEYENIFHAGNSTPAPQTPSSTQPPMIDIRTPQPNVQSLPPLVPNISLPAMPQPPLPEIPPQDIMLSYPKPLILIHRNQNRANVTNNSTASMQTQNVNSKNTDDRSRWMEYEERLAELERRQQEQAERLRQQERLRNREKDDNYSGEENGRNRGKQSGHGGKDCKGKEDASDENRSGEEESGQRFESREEGDKKPQESEEDEEVGLKDEDDGSYSVYGEPLPISKDDEQRRPEELRNSYGEPLDSRELTDNGYVDYFGKFKQQNDPPEEEEEDEEPSIEKIREEYDLPARNKYEEYTLEEDTDSAKKEEEDSEEDPPTKNSSKNSSKNKEEYDFSKHMSLFIPVRYLTVAEEPKKTQKDNIVPEATKKVLRKESKTSKKENPKSSIDFLERPKKLHDGERKELQMWPPPFDFILDGTIRTDLVPDSAEALNFHGKAKSYKENRKQGRPRTTLVPPAAHPASRPYDYQNIYQNFGKNLEPGPSASKQLTYEKSVNKRIMNRTRSEVRAKPDFNQRYRYASDDHKNVEEPHLRTKSSGSKKLESLKRSAKNIAPLKEKHFNEMYFGEEGAKDRRTQESQMMVLESPVKDYDYFRYGLNDHVLDYARGYEKLPEVFANDRQLYRYDESLTKLPNEPSSKNEKVATRDYVNDGNTMIALGQDGIRSTGPINYITYPRML